LELLKHPRVYRVADYLDVPDLQQLAAKNFKDELTQHWISDTFPYCIKEVYESNPGEDVTLRNIVVEAAFVHLRTLGRRKNFQNLVAETGAFANDLLQHIVRMADQTNGPVNIKV